MAAAETDGAENIRVAVRCRPLSKKEIDESQKSVFSDENGLAVMRDPSDDKEHKFAYDFVYGPQSSQQQVFEDIGIPMMNSAFGGYNGTIFAYGQTGSGKTHSMTGDPTPEHCGIIPRINEAIFERIAQEEQQSSTKKFLVVCSFFEIYNEIIFDLLDPTPKNKRSSAGLQIREHNVLGIYVKDLQEIVVDSAEKVEKLMAQGQQHRSVASTQMNAVSSRSHSVFTIKLHQQDIEDESKNVFAKVNLVDLAGSERAQKTGAQGDRLKEGANINKSLSSLGNVINGLVEKARGNKKTFVPYRDSKLTRVLQESLGGNCLCTMVATLSPAFSNFAETLGTLKYASRAKTIKVNAVRNEEQGQISRLNEEIEALKAKLESQSLQTVDPAEQKQVEDKYKVQIAEMEAMGQKSFAERVRLSEQHEEERSLMLAEKKAAEERVQKERERRWELLKEKGDVELTMKELTVTGSLLNAAIELRGLDEEVGECLKSVALWQKAFDEELLRRHEGKGSSEEDILRRARSDQLLLKLTSYRAELLKLEGAQARLGQALTALVESYDALQQGEPPSADTEQLHAFLGELLHRRQAEHAAALKGHQAVLTGQLAESGTNLVSTLEQVVEALQAEGGEPPEAYLQVQSMLQGALEAPGKLPGSLDGPNITLLDSMLNVTRMLLESSRVRWQLAEMRKRAAAMELEGAKNRVAALQQEKQELEFEQQRLQTLLDKARGGEKAAQKDAAAVQVKLSKELKQSEALQSELVSARYKIDTITDNHSEAQNTVRTLQEKLSALTEANTKLSVLQEEFASSAETTDQVGVCELQAKQLLCDGAMREKAQLEGEHATANAKLAELQEKLRQLQLEGELLRQQVPAQMQELQDVQTQLERAVENGSSQLEELEASKEQTARLRSQLGAAEKAVTELSSELNEFRRQALLQGELDKMNTELSMKQLEMQTELEQSRSRCLALEKHVEEKEATRAAAEASCQELEQEQKEQSTMLSEQLNSINVLTEERDSSRQKEEEYYNKIVDLEEEADGQAEGYIFVTEQKNELQDSVIELEEQLESLRDWRGTMATHASTQGAQQVKDTVQRLVDLTGQEDAPQGHDTPAMLEMLSQWIQSSVEKLEKVDNPFDADSDCFIAEDPYDDDFEDDVE